MGLDLCSALILEKADTLLKQKAVALHAVKN